MGECHPSSRLLLLFPRWQYREFPNMSHRVSASIHCTRTIRPLIAGAENVDYVVGHLVRSRGLYVRFVYFRSQHRYSIFSFTYQFQIPIVNASRKTTNVALRFVECLWYRTLELGVRSRQSCLLKASIPDYATMYVKGLLVQRTM